MSVDDPFPTSARSPWPDRWCEPWIAHEEPERPFDVGTWLCDCGSCRLALAAEARRHPTGLLCLKTGFDRIVLTAEYLHQVLDAGQPLESLLYVPDDYVREVFVPVNAWLPGGVRWRSITCMDDEKRAGRRPARRKVAVRQPEIARRRRRAEAASPAVRELSEVRRGA